MNMHPNTPINRRHLLASSAALGWAGSGAFSAALAQGAVANTAAANSSTSLPPLLAPNKAAFEHEVKQFSGGKTPSQEGLRLELSALADNPSAVPVRVIVTRPMTEQDWCEEIIVLAELNPLPLACRLQFGALSGQADAAVRIRLSQSQTIHALARMKSGQILAAQQAVTVAASGCGM